MKKIYTLLSILVLFCVQQCFAAPIPTPAPAFGIAPYQAENAKKTVPDKITQPVLQNPSPAIQKTVQQQVALSPTQKESINELRDQARFLYNTNNHRASLDVFNKIADENKTSEDWLLLANIAQDDGKLVDAVFYLKKAIEIDQNNYKAHYNLGNIYYVDNKVNMAIQEYTKAIKLKKDFAYAYYNRGCCYLKKKSWFNARYEFGLAIKANPNEPSFYYNLAYTNKMMKRAKKAQEALDMYNKLMTEN